jgi:tRNA (cytidine/uridine-2'-O-)-methyltransferase
VIPDSPKPHGRVYGLGAPWPDAPLDVVLVEPQIPPNTGNIARTCAATGCRLQLVGELGFEISDKTLKRAGLDYWDSVHMGHEPNAEAYLDSLEPSRVHLFTTAGSRSLYDTVFQKGDALLFGSETEGLPNAWLERFPDRTVAIPIRAEHVRSLNLAVSVGIAVYEALRQISQSS